MYHVHVVDRHGKPLMPTKRFGRVRRLLRAGKAVPVCNDPFTIKLKYDVPGFTQPILEGMRPFSDEAVCRGNWPGQEGKWIED